MIDNKIRGEFSSNSTRRDERYTSRFSVYVYTNENPNSTLLESGLRKESDAMKVASDAMRTDDNVTNAVIVEFKTVRTYHRHAFSQNFENGQHCTTCFGIK